MRCANWILAGCLIVVGCGKQYSAREAARFNDAKQSGLAREGTSYESARSGGDNSFTVVKPSADKTTLTGMLSMVDSSGSMAAVAGEKGKGLPSAALTPDRKIIYVADVTLVVADFSKTEKELPALVNQAGGYLADVTVDQSRGEHRSGRWVVRVPVEKFETFLDDLAKLGIPEGRHQTAQDVSEEYVDLEARIKNSKRLEERILKLVDERTGNIKDVVEAEQQLSRVREEIERMEGRLRYLANRTALTTVTITAREERDYKPPETPAFGARVSTSWSDSLVSLQDASERFLVGAVAAAPWICVWGLILSPGLIWARRRWKARRK
jgi:hypothetical protein